MNGFLPITIVVNKLLRFPCIYTHKAVDGIVDAALMNKINLRTKGFKCECQEGIRFILTL